MVSAGTILTVTATSEAEGQKKASAVVEVSANDSNPVITPSSLTPGTVGISYSASLSATGGLAPYHWSIVSGSLPPGMKLDGASGTISGSPEADGQFEFNILVSDNVQSVRKKYTLKVETPLTIQWNSKATVSGNRIDGSVKVSNHTGRDFDLTFIVLAVNDIGRATAIGYQHFS